MKHRWKNDVCLRCNLRRRFRTDGQYGYFYLHNGTWILGKAGSCSYVQKADPPESSPGVIDGAHAWAAQWCGTDDDLHARMAKSLRQRELAVTMLAQHQEREKTKFTMDTLNKRVLQLEQELAKERALK